MPQTPGFLLAWARVAPFFVSAVFFMSALFTLVAPLPILFLHLRQGRVFAWTAAITNSAIVYWAGGPESFAIYLTWILPLGLLAPEFMRKGVSLELTVSGTLSVIVLVGLAVTLGYGLYAQVHPLQEIRAQVQAMVEALAKSAATNRLNTADSQAELEVWKQGLMADFPSALAIFTLVMVWANIGMVLKANPLGVRERMGLKPAYFKEWKAPFWLVWPTIGLGAVVVFGTGAPATVAMGVLKFLMAIYAFQGVSILTFLFDVWKVRGFLRTAGFVVVVLVMTPLLISLGFFDQWFDFRGKFRQLE